MLQRLIYFSERDRCCSDVRPLVTKWAERNRRRGITGLLVADERCFLQMLEGDRNAVSALFQSINRDERHRNIVLVEAVEISDISTPHSPLQRLDESGEIAAAWKRVNFQRAFDPWSMSTDEIKRFLALVSYDMAAAREAAA